MKYFNLLKHLYVTLGILSVICFLPSGSANADDESKAGEVIKIAAMGDIMMGTENLLPADGGKSSFVACKKYLKDADIIFGNHEGTLTTKGKNRKVSKSGRSYSFKTPPSYARWMKEAGFNMVSIANNHINDYGAEGRAMTIATLKENGMAYSGPPGTVAELDIRGTKAAMVAFYSGSGSHKLNDIPTAKKIVSRLSKKYDIVIVSFHGGAEGRKATKVPKKMETFLGEKRGDVYKFSRAVVDSGADMVIGHGPHVPRAMELYKGRLIAYSIGNFCTGKGISVKGISGYAPLLLAEVDSEGKLIGGRVVSFIQPFGQAPQYDSKNRAAKLIHKLGKEDFPKTNVVDPEGKIDPALAIKN